MGKFTNPLQNHVQAFHEAFKHPVEEKPVPITLERAINRSIWTAEECIELIAATCTSKEQFKEAYSQFLNGLESAFEKSLNSDFPENDVERVVAQADALTDQLYFSFGTAVEIGVDIEPIFNIVQSANMSKLFTDADGHKYAKYREDGKVLKSPDFFSPEPLIKEEIIRQLKK